MWNMKKIKIFKIKLLKIKILKKLTKLMDIENIDPENELVVARGTGGS